MARFGLGLLIVLALSALAVPAEAQSGQAKSKDAGRKASAKVSHARSSDAEIRIIREYYGDPSRKLKPLPPGIAKNLARGKPIPPGIARTRMPDNLLVRLPARDGTHWFIAGDHVLLVDANNIVVDLFRAIF